MTMYYLVLYILGQGSAMAVIPEKYPSEEACHAAAKKDTWEHRCIIAPDTGYCAQALPNTNYIITVPCVAPSK